jgi:hypothetical protein
MSGKSVSFMRGEELITVAIGQKLILIEEALRFLRFEPILVLLYLRDGEEVEEFSPNRGIKISSRTLPPTTSAGNRVVASMRFGYTPMVRFTNTYGVPIGKAWTMGVRNAITSRHWRMKKCP